MVSDPLREVARHGLGEVVTADQDVHLVDLLGEEQRGLAGRVGASDHHDVLADTCPRLEFGRGVVDAATLELGDARDPSRRYWTPLAMTTARAATSLLVVEPDPESVRVCDSSVTERGETSRAPNLTACSIADRASSLPVTPRGKPR